MPDKVEDESSALNQFKTEFARRYCQNSKPGPNFTTESFSETLTEAFRGPSTTRKALGENYIIISVVKTTKKITLCLLLIVFLNFVLLINNFELFFICINQS